MTSGSLPIFFDISNAFSASAMDEDNLIDQFVSAGKRLVFMGDSTWSGLYPTQFNVSHPFPCYNIMDYIQWMTE
jgi:phosphatidylinositol glycan class O